MLIDELKIREKFLEGIITKTTNNLKTIRPGNIKISLQHGNPRFYYKATSDSKAIYLPKSEMLSAGQIIQQNYDQHILKIAEKELKLVDKLLRLETPDAFVAEYEKLGKYRKGMITPYKVSDIEYAEKWQSVEYQQRKPYPGEAMHHSLKGELVHSKSEANIADTCYALGIPYRYEYPHRIFVPDIIYGASRVDMFAESLTAITGPTSKSNDKRKIYHESGNKQIWYPDFTALNVKTRQEYIIEFFGLMGDDAYREKALKKIEIYEANDIYIGLNLIAFFDGGDFHTDEKRIKKTLEKFLIS